MPSRAFISSAASTHVQAMLIDICKPANTEGKEAGKDT
jgi:hypothetical protein